MHRRSVILGGATLFAAQSLRAAEIVIGNTPVGPARRAFVSHPPVVKQQCPLWCWAASASMIFAAHGRQVPQQAIVTRLFGDTVCASSGMHRLGPTGTITQDLSSPWTDSSGNSFQPTIVAGYDIYRNINAIDNYFIINELRQDRPVLYCNQTHAMVVVAVEYIDTPMGPDVRAVGVIDPHPAAADFHVLSLPEMRLAHLGGHMSYLASVHI